MKSGNKRWPRAASIRSSLIRLGPDHAARALLAGENAFARFGFSERNHANCHLQIVLDLLFHFARVVPMREREAAVDLRFGGVFRSEEVVEFFFRFNHARVLLL